MAWDWEKLQDKHKKRGSDIPPQMDDFIKQFKSFKFPGGAFIIIFVIIALIGSTMIFQVEVDEVGIVQRFGKFVRKADPGLNFKWPLGVEKVTKVKVKRVKKEEFGYIASQGSSMQADSEENVALMLTGDLNVAVVPWIVQYRINDPYNYLFKVEEVERLLRDMSEATMRLVIGDRSITEVISKRQEIADEAKELLQEEMDKAESGLVILTIEMKRTNVPAPVQPSFNEVNQATQEKEKLIYQAQEEYNKAIPAAKGEAERTIKSAEGYKLDRVNRALGDAARFTLFYEEYQKAQDVTKRRMYLETIKNLYPKLGDKYIIDSNQNNMLPLLNLGKEGKVRQ